MKSNVKNRFLKYVQIDTEADPLSESCPSSMKQKDLGNLLVKELTELGIDNAFMDEYGYVYAKIPSNSNKMKIPKLFFCAHMDTAPDCSGNNVKPLVHEKWNGEDIVLPDDNSVIISRKNHPYLKEKIGEDIITASGKTLLGADDKAGIAIIMDFAEKIVLNKDISHGEIRILFTPDEEIGRGVDKVNTEILDADFGYTLDGGELGTIEDETFSADFISFKINGVATHPGYAKGKMKNASKILADFLSALPSDSWCPEATDGREGFVHPVSIKGGLETAEISFIIRDHDTKKLVEYKNRLIEILTQVIEKYEGSSFTFQLIEQYRNMKEILSQFPFVVDYAIEAMKRANIKTKNTIIRGGTDGSRLSFMNLPCPNLFTGEMGIHSKEEYVSVQDMEKAVSTLIELVQVWEEKTN
ncbi:MAG: peptidase T [Flavobacteriia bacterium]|nr:peptidase T [Flavobacteriia bacterium]